MIRVGRVRAAAVAAVAIALAGCDGGDAATPTRSPSPSPVESPSPSRPPETVTPTATASQGPTGSPAAPPVLRLPEDAPVAFDGEVSADGPFEELIPPGAEVLDAWYRGPFRAMPAWVGVVWARGDDPFARELGLVLWQRAPDAPSWRVAYAITDPPERGVLGISVELGEVTGDAVDDVLSFEETGGSGACGTWRVISPVPGGALTALKRRTCDARISVVAGHLQLREAVFEPGDAHCCPSAFRTTTLEWDGTAFVSTDVREEPGPTG